MAAKRIVFVESPAKAKTIQKFVDKSTVVRATFGHVRDLPKSNLGVDVEHGFEPKYIVPKKSSPVVKELKALTKGVDEIYLATDPDREGEAIAWHLLEVLDIDENKAHRILFHEITNQAITAALEHPGKINHHLVDAQQGRRVLDRLVGYKLSPLLWQKLYRGLSAGRVQSAALRLIVDREAEIAAFKSQEYWSLWATFVHKSAAQFMAKLEKVNGKALSKYPAQDIIDQAREKSVNDAEWVVLSRESEKKQRHPKPPFTTSTLQQEAGRKLRFSVKQTMMHAQKLYEGVSLGGETVGLITYMRTDSVHLAETAQHEAREVITKVYGREYVPAQAKQYKTKSKGAQEAHEAIRPTSFARTPEDIKAYVSPQEFKLYKLIWERGIASQMVSADTEVTQIRVGLAKDRDAVVYLAHGVQIVFPGFLKVYDEDTDETPDKEAVEAGSQVLPDVAAGDAVDLDELEAKQHFTQPPARFTEASLVKEMEKLGIGRPSTYAPTISTLIDRGYVTKEDNKFTPQEVGQLVIQLLKEKFPNIVDYDFTAKMEESLDAVAEGKEKWQEVIGDFYKPFIASIDTAAKEIDGKKVGEEVVEEACPNCGKPLMIKWGRFGKFYACSGFPECRFTRPLEKDAEAQKQDEKLIEGRKCPEDEGDLVVKTSRFGSFIGCANYPKCKYTEPILKPIGVKCPKDGGDTIERRSRRGKYFWGCANYPKCDFVSWDKPVPEPCPTCKGMVVVKKNELVCVNGDYRRPVEEKE